MKRRDFVEKTLVSGALLGAGAQLGIGVGGDPLSGGAAGQAGTGVTP